MADQSDVEQALVTAVSAALVLEAPTFTLSVSGQAITVGGAQPTSFYAQQIAITVAGQPTFAYQTLDADTTESIAIALGALIDAAIPAATVSGSTIALPSGPQITYAGVSAVASALGCPARIGRGWPNPPALDADLRAGVLNITVYARPGMERNVTRYLSRWVSQPASAATFALTQSGQTLTVGGAQPAAFYAHNLAVLIEGDAYVYTTVSDDTTESIAIALGALIDAAWPGVEVSGAEITLPTTALVDALRVGTSGQALRELTRQERQFQVVVWAFGPETRDQACSQLKPALDQIEFLTMPDGSAARLIYAGSASDDAPQKELLYRRDLFYLAEWATFQTAEAVQIVAFGTEFETAAGDEIAETFV